MKMTLVFSAVVFSGLLMSGCGPKLLEPYKKIDPIPGGKGVIYIFHDPASFTPYAYTIKLNGKDLVALKPGAYYPLITEFGEVQLSASLETSASLTIDVKPGSAHYVRFYLSKGVIANRPNLVEVLPQAAESSIANCREVPPISN